MADPKWKNGLPSNWVTAYSQPINSLSNKIRSAKPSVLSPEKFGWEKLGGTYEKTFPSGGVGRLVYHPLDGRWAAQAYLFTADAHIAPDTLRDIGNRVADALQTGDDDVITYHRPTERVPLTHIGVWENFIAAGWRVSGGNRYSLGKLVAFFDWRANDYTGGWHVYLEVAEYQTESMDAINESIEKLAGRVARIVTTAIP